MIVLHDRIVCEDCKHYEAYHQYPNPLAYARHYCKKCNEKIQMVRTSMYSDRRIAYLPKGCYFNDYFEKSEECKKREQARQDTFNFWQIED